MNTSEVFIHRVFENRTTRVCKIFVIHFVILIFHFFRFNLAKSYKFFIKVVQTICDDGESHQIWL